MVKRGIPANGRGARAAGDTARIAIRNKGSRKQFNGGRAVPGKAPRGSFPTAALSGFSPLGRAILEKVDRGIVLLDMEGAIVDANSVARQVLASGNGLQVRGGRFAFSDAAIDARLEHLLNSSGKADAQPRVIAASVKRAGSATCRVLVSPFMLEDGHAHAAAYIVVIYAPAEQPDIAAEVLLEIYGLTRAQRSIVAPQRPQHAALHAEHRGGMTDELAVGLDAGGWIRVDRHARHDVSPHCRIAQQGASVQARKFRQGLPQAQRLDRHDVEAAVVEPCPGRHVHAAAAVTPVGDEGKQVPALRGGSAVRAVLVRQLEIQAEYRRTIARQFAQGTGQVGQARRSARGHALDHVRVEARTRDVEKKLRIADRACRR